MGYSCPFLSLIAVPAPKERNDAFIDPQNSFNRVRERGTLKLWSRRLKTEGATRVCCRSEPLAPEGPMKSTNHCKALIGKVKTVV